MADSQQAAALIDGLQGVMHVVADAAKHSSDLRGRIEGDLGADSYIQTTSSRAIKPPLDPDLYA